MQTLYNVRSATPIDAQICGIYSGAKAVCTPSQVSALLQPVFSERMGISAETPFLPFSNSESDCHAKPLGCRCDRKPERLSNSNTSRQLPVTVGADRPRHKKRITQITQSKSQSSQRRKNLGASRKEEV
jgi:hypothetical protein